MSIEFLPVEKLSSVICDNIKNPDVVFVFSTDIDMTSWAEWCVINSETTGVKTVSMDRFMAWDDFKRQFVVASEKDKHSVPSLLRKVFIHDLIAKNADAAAAGKPLFKSIINPVYAKDGASFCDWISGNIPALKIWHERYEKLVQKGNYIPDDEDRDYEFLYKQYCDFLGTEMFEPSWITPDFSATDTMFLIFFPEQFADYEEYKPILKNVPSVVLYEMEECKTKPVVYKYEDARKELRHTVLAIRDLVESSNGAIKYNDVALHAPKLDTYLPYVEREFKNYCVPYVVRSGSSFTVNNAGSIFENISQCRTDNYSFSSVRALLLNTFIPWKEKTVNESVIRLGSAYHCICNYEEGREKDVWIRALKQDNRNTREYEFYKLLRKDIECMCDCTNFEGIKKAWNGFKQDFLLDDEFSQEANNILSRCIVLLDELIKLEKDFIEPGNLAVYKPYEFFIKELRDKTYNPQQRKTGVNIFEYRVAACASYKYNFVINCNQNAITIAKKQLGFLNNQKREALGIKDEDSATSVYISLYKKFDEDDKQNTIYTFSENSFDGFAIPHNYFEVLEERPAERETRLEKLDFIKSEKNWFINQKEIPEYISENQKKEYENWKLTADYSLNKNEDYSVDESLKEGLDFILSKNRSKDSEEYLKITQTDLKNFFPCARFWLLKTILQLHEDSIDATLLDTFAKGNISHKTLELLFNEFKAKYGSIPVCTEGSFGDNQEEIKTLVKNCVNKSIDENRDYRESPLAYEVLVSQKYLFEDIIMNFLYKFCKNDSQKSFGGYKIVDTEKWYSCKDDDKDYGLAGQIDCILCDEDGNIAIVDYKSSGVPNLTSTIADEENETLGDFQCAAYVTLYNKQKNNSVKVSKMLFTSIQGKGETLVIDENPSSRSNTKTPEEYESTLNVLNSYVDVCAQKIKNYDFKPVSDPDAKYDDVNIYRDCLGCNFKSVCRSTFTVAGHKL